MYVPRCPSSSSQNLSAVLSSPIASFCQSQHLHTFWELGPWREHVGILPGQTLPRIIFSNAVSPIQVPQGRWSVSWLSRNQPRNEISITSFSAETTNLYNSWTVFIFLTSGREVPPRGWKCKVSLYELCTLRWPFSTLSLLTLLFWQRGEQRLEGGLGSELVPRKWSDRSLNLECQALRTFFFTFGL